MPSQDLFTPFKLGTIGSLSNRMALAPMTRARATPEGVVGDHHVDYYVQRSNAGLVITEGTFISNEAVGWYCAPAIDTDEKAQAWKKVTEAVHKAGSKIVLQLWHTGRASHPDFHGGKPAVSSTTKPLSGEIHVKDGKKPYESPRILEIEEIPRLVKDYAVAAERAIDSGFDGVEIHSANGYILDQFLQSAVNEREDKYGGSLENRLRLLDEVIEGVIEKVPASKVGVRFSPNGVFNEMGSSDFVETFDAAIKLAASKKLAFVHVMDGLAFGFHELGPQYTLERARSMVAEVQGSDQVTAVIGNCGHTKESGEEQIKKGHADLIAYGRPWIANPDLVQRFQKNIPLREVEGTAHFYSGGSPTPRVGFTDFAPAEEE